MPGTVLVHSRTRLAMRILFAADVDPDPDSGAAGTEWRTIQALRELGHEVDEIWARDLGRRIRHGNLHYLLELPYRYREVIGERCRTQDYDVIHVNQGHCYLAAIEHRRRRRHGVFVCRSHGLDDHMEIVLAPWRQRLGIRGGNRIKRIASRALDVLLRRHDRLAYRSADGVLVSSSIDANFLRNHHGIPQQRIACVAQAPATAFVDTPAPPMTLARLNRILHVGGFAYWKGVHAVAAAANNLLTDSGTMSMTWVCRDEEHDQVRALLTPQARARVELRGWTNQAALRDIYDAHGIFLYPSLFDGFGKVFLEAMARGLCVVGTRSGGMRDIIEEGVNGLIVGFNDASALAAAVRQLNQAPNDAQRLAGAAAATARMYSWNRVGVETLTFYDSLIANVGKA